MTDICYLKIEKKGGYSARPPFVERCVKLPMMLLRGVGCVD
jgi:hypothetical protein